MSTSPLDAFEVFTGFLNVPENSIKKSLKLLISTKEGLFAP
jgi:hypothetical protein